MLDIGWSEIMVIAVVAIVVIGPKELPAVLRGVGRSLTKMRKMAGEFRSQFDDALKEADLQDLKESANTLRDTMGSLRSGLSPIGAIKNELLSAEEAVKQPIASTSSPLPVVTTPTVASMPTEPVPAAAPVIVPPVPAAALPLTVVAENKPKRAKPAASASPKPSGSKPTTVSPKLVEEKPVSRAKQRKVNGAAAAPVVPKPAPRSPSKPATAVAAKPAGRSRAKAGADA